jgi:hypothetical protein
VNALRRNLLLILTAAATVIGLTAGTAQAAFDDRATMNTLTISTATVAAPTTVTAQQTTCNWNRTQSVQITWAASTSARVSGYTVTVSNTAGSTLATGQVGATARSVTVSFDRQSYDISTLTFSVTTVTDYGWTAVSPRKAALPC